jgi:hydrogenase-4 component F
MFSFLLAPLLIFVASFFDIKRVKFIMPVLALFMSIPLYLSFGKGDISYYGDLFILDNLARYILSTSVVVGVAITLAMMSLDKHVQISEKAYKNFYRFFALFWIGLTVSIISNSMGIYWIGLETATLSTVYMIKTNSTAFAHKEAWNYMIVGAIAISLILFGIILIYASAKPYLGEDAIKFSALLTNVNAIKHGYLFELGFAFVAVGSFIKMGFFPMNLWLANIERASFYPVAALFSGILESAIMIGFFRFSLIAKEINYSHLIGFSVLYSLLTLFVVSFLLYRVKDFMRLFSLSGIEHMAIISIFWVSGAHFAALLHFGAHAFLKPALFISTGVLESGGKYHIAGALRGYATKKGRVFAFTVGALMLSIISLPPSPMFFSELYGFGGMIELAKTSHHLLLMIGAVALLLLFLSIIFYKFIEVYQSMKYEGIEVEKKVYLSEMISIVILAISSLVLLMPQVFTFLRNIG